MFQSKWAIILAVGLSVLSRGAFADLKEAQRYYAEGSRLERSADYQGALKAYEESLRQEPRYFYAYRQIGICEQMLGHADAAVAAFDKYLASKPDDLQIKNLEQSLKNSHSHGAPTNVAATAAEEPFRHRFGARLLAGYGFGSTNSYGGFNTEQYSGYPETPGAGFSYGGDVTWELMPHLEIGLGMRPISMHTAASSSSTVSWVNADNTYDTAFNSFPILASLFFSLPLAPKWNLVTGVSLGLSPGMEINYSNLNVYRNSDITEDMKGKFDTGLAAAYGGTLGAEYQISRSFSIFAGLDLLSVAYPPVKQQNDFYDTKTSTGKKTSETHYTYNFSANPTKHANTVYTTSTVTNGNIQTTTQNWDSGSWQEVQVTTLNTSTFETYTDTTYTYSESSQGNYDVLRLSMMLGVVYRY